MAISPGTISNGSLYNNMIVGTDVHIHIHTAMVLDTTVIR